MSSMTCMELEIQYRMVRLKPDPTTVAIEPSSGHPHRLFARHDCARAEHRPAREGHERLLCRAPTARSRLDLFHDAGREYRCGFDRRRDIAWLHRRSGRLL